MFLENCALLDVIEKELKQDNIFVNYVEVQACPDTGVQFKFWCLADKFFGENEPTFLVKKMSESTKCELSEINVTFPYPDICCVNFVLIPPERKITFLFNRFKRENRFEKLDFELGKKLS